MGFFQFTAQECSSGKFTSISQEGTVMLSGLKAGSVSLAGTIKSLPHIGLFFDGAKSTIDVRKGVLYY